MKEENIVIVSQQPWDTDIGSNCKDIALELSKKNNVLYINSPLDRITLMRNRNNPDVRRRIDVIKGRKDGLVMVGDRLWNLYPDCMVESVNWIRNHTLFNYLNRRNGRLLSDAIRRALNRLRFSDFILFNDNEIFKGFYLKDFLVPKLSIYYSRDYMLGVDYWKRHGTRLEPMLIAKSDLIFCNSVYLADYCGQYNKQSYYVGQGCDESLFAPVTIPRGRPEDLPQGGTKIIGYVGSLDSNRLDIQLLESLAARFPDASLVLVGPEDDIFRNSVLHGMSNVLFLGKKPVDELPAYIAAFDVCINPQTVNAITIGNYPRKIDEYLALGKPAVATYTRAMDAFAGFVYLANSGKEFGEFVRTAIEEDNDEKQAARRTFAAQHTWEHSVKEMSKYVAIHLGNKNS